MAGILCFEHMMQEKQLGTRLCPISVFPVSLVGLLEGWSRFIYVQNMKSISD